MSVAGADDDDGAGGKGGQEETHAAPLWVGKGTPKLRTPDRLTVLTCRCVPQPHPIGGRTST
ncbi:hypothetical protein Slala04_25860 [Streptomyces lavendulae subsp. lavendulae]|nr:hypothetical protein Slala04_25860 [Streptomyces lavendulae subsp. lavendulae]